MMIKEEASIYESDYDSCLDRQGSMPEEMFKIRNLDTGEEIDVRDENKTEFASQYTSVLSMKASKIELEEFYKEKRKMNQSLWAAVQRNDVNRCKELLDREIYGELVAQPNSKGLNEWTALHMAAADGFYDACEVVLLQGEKPNVDSRTSIGRTPLHLACVHGQLNVAKLLVEHGADTNAQDLENNTPTHYSAMYGHADMVTWLLEQKPDIFVTNVLGKTSFDYMINIETYEAFYKHCKKNNLKLPSTPYNRTPFFGVILHNSREDHINKMMLKGNIKPREQDLKTFNDRPKLQLFKKTLALPKTIELPLPPSKVGPSDFRGILQLGKGSFGEVFLVEKIDSGQQFALKTLKKEKVLGNNLIRYAFTERNILKNINHPYIVKLNYSFQTPEKLCMVMDYCGGGDLGLHLAREKRFTDEKARFYICEILLALEELHKHGIIFRDLKPENVVLNEEGHAKLTDFGLSKEGVTEGQISRSFCGSVAYLAPEMLRRSGHTRSVDWYLLGVIMYEMLVGTPPYYSSNREQLFNNIQRGKLKVPKHLSVESKTLIKQLLHRDPTKRLGAGPGDSEEIKSHEFFRDVNWEAYLQKQVKAPEIKPVRRIPKEITAERMFGVLEEEEKRLDDWSFINPVKGLSNTIK